MLNTAAAAMGGIRKMWVFLTLKQACNYVLVETQNTNMNMKTVYNRV